MEGITDEQLEKAAKEKYPEEFVLKKSYPPDGLDRAKNKRDTWIAGAKYILSHSVDRWREAQDLELKDFVVVFDNYDERLWIWSKDQYDSYVDTACSLGAIPSVRLVTHFNQKDSLINQLSK